MKDHITQAVEAGKFSKWTAFWERYFCDHPCNNIESVKVEFCCLRKETHTLTCKHCGYVKTYSHYYNK